MRRPKATTATPPKGKARAGAGTRRAALTDAFDDGVEATLAAQAPPLAAETAEPDINDRLRATSALERRSGLTFYGSPFIREDSPLSDLLATALRFGDDSRGPLANALESLANEVLVATEHEDKTHAHDWRDLLYSLDNRLRILAEVSRRVHTSAIDLIAESRKAG